MVSEEQGKVCAKAIILREFSGRRCYQGLPQHCLSHHWKNRKPQEISLWYVGFLCFLLSLDLFLVCLWLAVCLWFPLYLYNKDKCIYAIPKYSLQACNEWSKKSYTTQVLFSHCLLRAPCQLPSANRKVAFRSALPLAGIQFSAQEQQGFLKQH